MITLRYAHLADYASEGARGKMIVVGIFDRVFTTAPAESFQLPHCYLAMKFEASLMDGGDHLLEVKLVDGNGTPVLPEHPRIPLRFGTVGPGYPLAAMVVLQLQNLTIPGIGDWAFEIRVDGAIVGEVQLIAAEAPTA